LFEHTINWQGGAVTLELTGSSEEEMRKSFDAAMLEMFPKLNKMQEYLYYSRVHAFTREMLKDIVKNNRGMGKTTAHAMKQIAEAIQHPGKEIKLCNDEFASIHATTKVYINDVVKPMIEKLGLKFMVINENRQTLKFDV
jgi:hypothetical protein